MVISTEFDGLLEEDVTLEETEQTPEYSDILKNSENLMKSFLYMKKMFNSSPLLNEIVKLSTLEVSTKTEYVFNSESNMIMIKNISDTNSSLFVNNGELILLPFESFEFPLKSTYTVEIQGKFSIAETKYTIG